MSSSSRDIYNSLLPNSVNIVYFFCGLSCSLDDLITMLCYITCCATRFPGLVVIALDTIYSLGFQGYQRRYTVLVGVLFVPTYTQRYTAIVGNVSIPEAEINMDLTKLCGSSFDEKKSHQSLNYSVLDTLHSAESFSQTFLNDVRNPKLTNSVGDILSVKRNRLGRQFVSQPSLNTSHMKQSQSMTDINLSKTTAAVVPNQIKSLRFRPGLINKKALPGVSYSIQERPADRADIARLEYELEEKVRNVLFPDIATLEALESGKMHQPHKDKVAFLRYNILKGFTDISPENFDDEPWLDRLIQCECLQQTCDGVSKKLIDMLYVSSTELGNVLRKLRLTYQQTSEQSLNSWRHLRKEYLRTQRELIECQESLHEMKAELEEREEDVKKRIEEKIELVKAEYEEVRQKDRALLADSELQIDQLSETLSSLNVIFKTMQADASSVASSDLLAKVSKLEKDNGDLQVRCQRFEAIKIELQSAQEKNKSLEMEIKMKDLELSNSRSNLLRREEVVASLMEKEAVRDAEIEKLQKQIKSFESKKGTSDEVDFTEPATSILCIKCKKSLDDLTNIRAAILGDKNEVDENNKAMCELFRILLPNLRGKRPDRSINWIRLCARSVLFSKMKEDISLVGFKADSSRFPQFVYSFFEKKVEGITGSALQTALMQADDNRWGFYYGLKALSRDDPEGILIWSLLDETYGEDGLQFTLHCLSVVMSMSGSELWKQFGATVLTKGSDFNAIEKDLAKIKIRRYIWLDYSIAVEAVKAILNRALSSHLLEALEAIDALRVLPEEVDPQVKEMDFDITMESGSLDCETTEGIPITPYEETKGDAIKKNRLTDATHIDLFMWMRIMMQLFQAEQIHRAAAIRLMFETASVGALTPQLPTSILDQGNPGAKGSQVEYPQFSSITKTIFPNISTTEIATMYGQCYSEGRKKVTADVFIKISDRFGMFSRAMTLSTLPLLEKHTPKYILQEPTKKETLSASAFAVAQVDGNVSEQHQGDETEELIVVEETVEEKLEKYNLQLTTVDQINSDTILRVKLGSLVHRKFAAILPDLNILLMSVPERWKALLSSSIDDVQQSLKDSFQKMKKKNFNDDFKSKRFFMDGIQPYVVYRRLLSVMLLIKSITDNPLLPTELFMGKNRNFLPNLDIGLLKAEEVLAALERSIVMASNTDTPYSKSKYVRYEAARRSITARRIQFAVRRFFNRSEVVPRIVRIRLRPGYLRGVGKDSIRTRSFVNKPSWAECLIAEVFCFKINYDKRAAFIGLKPIPLSEAICAFFYVYFGSVDIAERYIHDLFVCIRHHADGSPRMKMLAMFLGIDCTIEDEVEREMLQTPQAVAVYFNLILCIHREATKANSIAKKKAGDLTVDAKKIAMSDNGLSIVGQGTSIQTKQQVTVQDMLNTNANGNNILSIPTLYPSSEVTSAPAHTIWLENAKVAGAAATAWASAQKGVDQSSVHAYTDIAEQLCLTGHDMVDVDAFLLIEMLQWAKFTTFYVARGASRADGHDRNGFTAKSKMQYTDSIISAMGSKDKTNIIPPRFQIPQLPFTYLQGLVESIYKPGEGATVADPNRFTSLYLDMVVAKGVENTISGVTAQKAYEKEQSPTNGRSQLISTLLKDCILWDTVVGDNDSRYMKESFDLTFGSSPALLLEMYLKTFEDYGDVFNNLINSMDSQDSRDVKKYISTCKKAQTQLEDIFRAKTKSGASITEDTIKVLGVTMSSYVGSVALLLAIAQKPFPMDPWKNKEGEEVSSFKTLNPENLPQLTKAPF